jgi:hypothetical protein
MARPNYAEPVSVLMHVSVKGMFAAQLSGMALLNTNYRIILEDGKIIGTPNTEFHEVSKTPSTQTIEDVGAKQYDWPKVRR